MKRSDFLFDFADFCCHKIGLSRGGSYIDSPNWIKNKNATINRGFQPLTIITKRSILDVAVALDPPLINLKNNDDFMI